MVGILYSTPSYSKTLKYFRPICAHCCSSLEFFIFVNFGFSSMGDSAFPTEFYLLSRFILIFNCTRGSFNKKITEIADLLMVFSNNTGGGAKGGHTFVSNRGISL